MSMLKELEVKNELHKNDDWYTQNAEELGDNVSRFRPGSWIFVGIPGNVTKRRTDSGTKQALRILQK